MVNLEKKEEWILKIILFLRIREVRDCDTMEYFPSEIAFPQVLLTDHLKQAISDMVSILTNLLSITRPSL